ncbi:MAG: hypothetical protein LBI15_04385 [Dysgonamonadaceae bacterium]|jgi:hypothetical protein|nr:hypothetical protein [Dysgonamonadaceae bacterium]
MLYNVTIDTSTTSGKRALQDLKRYRKGVEFATPTNKCIPPGYMTGDEFEKRVMEELEKKLKDNGYLE